jgi:hypothetical protein
MLNMPQNESQKRSAAYRLAEVDPDFILSESMRGVRFFLEFAKAEERLQQWRIRSTIVVFGSARARPGRHNGAAPLIRPAPDADFTARAAWWYEEARRLARIVSERGGATTPVNGVRQNVIATGGGPGIMEAANRGAFESGAPSIGFNIELPQEQQPNSFTTPELTFQFHYFAMRKMHLAMRAAALIVFPGGFGTLDELFEILTLVQTRKAPVIPVLCFDRAYWNRLVNFDALVEDGLISQADHDLVRFVDHAEEAWAALETAGIGVRHRAV